MNAGIMYDQARSLFQSHQYDEALKKLKELVQQSNLAHKIHAMIADCYLANNQLDMAILSEKQVPIVVTRYVALRSDAFYSCSFLTRISLFLF